MTHEEEQVLSCPYCGSSFILFADNPDLCYKLLCNGVTVEAMCANCSKRLLAKVKLVGLGKP